jgi:hypothetical protein
VAGGSMKAKLPHWTPFKPAEPLPISEANLRDMARNFDMTIEQMRTMMEEERKVSNIFLNSRYQVDVRDAEPAPGWPQMKWLSIKRLDRAPIGEERFRDFQRIKNELVGKECEAVELYPAESRLVDTANQYHLWVIAEPGQMFPFGFGERLTSYKEKVGGAVQRPHEDAAE